MPAIRESVEPIYSFYQIRAHSFGFYWGYPGNKRGRINLVSRQEGNGVNRPAQVGIDLSIGLGGPLRVFEGIPLCL